MQNFQLEINEVPKHFQMLFDFKNQARKKISTRGNILYIEQKCSECGFSWSRAVTDIRQSIKKGAFSGMCHSCSAKAPKNYNTGKKSANWKGGVIRHIDGYLRKRQPNHPNANNGYVLEHRLVMEKHLGRHLLPKETVHHKNGKKDDNRIENLELWGCNHGTGSRYEDWSNREIEQLIDHLQTVLIERR